MKKIALICMTFLFSLSLTASEIKDFYAYIGGGLGIAKLSTDIVSDRGDKDGSVLSGSIFGTYYQKNWVANIGFGYYDLSLETKDKGANFVKLITETFYVDLVPQYRITKRFSVGLSYQHLLGEEFLAAPSTLVNVNNETTTQSLAGLVVQYDIPFKSFRIRVGATIHKALSVGERDIYLGLLSLHFGTAIYDNEDEAVRIVYREREVVKMIPAEVIELGEQVINFKTGSSRLSDFSTSFVEKLAVLLKENLGSWEVVKIVGHTDIVGPEDANQRLSERRANSVKDILISNEVPRDRVFFIGLGESMLKTEGTAPEDHLTNRRVELQFIGQLEKEFVNKVKKLVAEAEQQ